MVLRALCHHRPDRLHVTIATKRDSFHGENPITFFPSLGQCLCLCHGSSNALSPAAAPKQFSTCKHWFCQHRGLQPVSCQHCCPRRVSSLLRTGWKRGGCSQQTTERLLFLGCRRCVQHVGPQVGANLNQTCFNQKLKHNSKRRTKSPSQKPALPQPPKPYRQMQARKTWSTRISARSTWEAYPTPCSGARWCVSVRFCSRLKQRAHSACWHRGEPRPPPQELLACADYSWSVPVPVTRARGARAGFADEKPGAGTLAGVYS